MIILPYKMIADLMMSDGEYNFLIVCRTPRQAEIVYNWFIQNIDDGKTTHLSREHGYIGNKKNVLYIKTNSENIGRGRWPHLIIADITANDSVMRAISFYGFPPLIKDMDWEVAGLEQDLVLNKGGKLNEYNN